MVSSTFEDRTMVCQNEDLAFGCDLRIHASGPVYGNLAEKARHSSIQNNDGPNCTDINWSIDTLGWLDVNMSYVVTNEVASALSLRVEDSIGTIIFEADNLNDSSIVSIQICDYLSEGLFAFISNAEGSCRSHWTFKKSSRLFLPGSSVDLWCLDQVIPSPQVYQDMFGVKKVDQICSDDSLEATFVADWVTPFRIDSCRNDTVKVIYREFEVCNEFGRRNFIHDTLVVFGIPNLMDENINCPDQVELKLGELKDFEGPKIELGNEIIDTMIFDLLTVSAVEDELQFTSKSFDPRCGLYINGESVKISNGCNQEYLVSLDLLQICPKDSTVIFSTSCEFTAIVVDTSSSAVVHPTCFLQNQIANSDTFEIEDCTMDLEFVLTGDRS